MPAGRTDLPLVRRLMAMQAKKAKQAKASSSPSQPRYAKHKPTPKPSIKSYRLASQSTSRLSTPAGSSKQEPPLVEEIVSSPESSPIRETGTAPTEQGSPQVSPAESSAKGTGKAPAEPNSEQTPPT